MEFNKTDKIVHLIQTNYHLLPIFHRFGFRLGFGNKSVVQICEETDINADFFLSIVNTFHNKNYFPKERLLSFSPLLIIDYLKKTHQYYKKYSLPKIESILQVRPFNCTGMIALVLGVIAFLTDSGSII